MPLLEDQHRPEPDSPLATPTNVDSLALGLAQDLVPTRRIPGNECALAFAAQILDLLGVLLREALETVVEVVAGFGGVADQVQTFDFLDDGTEEDGAGRVTCVILAWKTPI